MTKYENFIKEQEKNLNQEINKKEIEREEDKNEILRGLNSKWYELHGNVIYSGKTIIGIYV